jgi:hypothetical protein
MSGYGETTFPATAKRGGSIGGVTDFAVDGG